jgi:hypothetical protein
MDTQLAEHRNARAMPAAAAVVAIDQQDGYGKHHDEKYDVG